MDWHDAMFWTMVAAGLAVAIRLLLERWVDSYFKLPPRDPSKPIVKKPPLS